jgi:hypothetical protein
MSPSHQPSIKRGMYTDDTTTHSTPTHPLDLRLGCFRQPLVGRLGVEPVAVAGRLAPCAPRTLLRLGLGDCIGGMRGSRMRTRRRRDQSVGKPNLPGTKQLGEKPYYYYCLCFIF